jgi:hypothetical protein
MFFWFPKDDYRRLTVKARACNDGNDQRVTGVTEGRPIGVVFDPGGVDQGIPELVKCLGPGTPVLTPKAYADATKTNECQYIHKHSSSSVGSSYHGMAAIEYQIWIGGGPGLDPDLFIDPGNIWWNDRNLEIPVGEIEGLVK